MIRLAPVARFLLLLLLVAAGVRTVHAQTHGRGGLVLGDSSVYRFVPPTSDAHKNPGAADARFDVVYEGFTTEARRAFQYAVDIWETHVSSNVPIRIEASFTDLSDDDESSVTLGAARGTFVFANQSRFPFDETWYQAALAKAVQRTDLTAGTGGEADEADIAAFFNSDFDGWYYGTDGNPPAGRIDFVTVVLHEIGHGLGFQGSLRYDDGVGDDECPDGDPGVGCWGLGGQRFPYVYDRFTEDDREVRLLNTLVYPNPSQALGQVIRSDAVFFDGATVRLTNLDIPVDLYAPSNFEPGSSFSHLDEEAFPPGTANALMTPTLNRNEAIHSPGALTCAILQDLGWPLGRDCIALVFENAPVEISSLEADFTADEVVVSWRVTRPSGVERFELLARYFDEPLEVVATVPAEDGTFDYEVALDGLAPGLYTFRLRTVLTGEGALTSDALTLSVPVPDVLLVQPPFPNPATEAATVDVLVQSRQEVAVDVFDAAGRRVARVFDGQMVRDERYRLAIDVAGWAPGVYFVRAQGLSGYTRTTQIVVVR